MVETVITTIEDEFKTKMDKYLKRREVLVLIVCVFTSVLSIPTLCPVIFTEKIIHFKIKFPFN